MKLSEYILQKSGTKTYTWMVFVMTLLESIFLFIPPEIFMAPAIISDKKRTLPVIIAASLGSLIGGCIVYFIGVWLYDSLGLWLINFVSSPAVITNTIEPLFNKYGILIIVLTAVTPVPYKVLGLWLGFINYPLILFLGVSAIFRTGRFALIGYLLYKFQERANSIVKKYFWYLVFGAIAFALIGLLVLAL